MKNPTKSSPDADADYDELLARWTPIRERMELLVGEPRITAAGIMHPFSGPLNREESVDFLAKHFKHHLRQLGRIQSHPDFPAS